MKPAISVTKTANPTVVQDSGLVTFTAVVTNTSSVDPLTIDTLTDSIYGNLLTGSTKATCTFGGNVVSLPYTLPVHESLVCTFQATVTQTETDVVTSSGTDDEQNRVTAHDDATVTVNHTPPPPPPAPKTDVAIQKDATAQVTLGSNGQATIVYDFAVKNNGPDPAANVTVSDPAPSGVTFVERRAAAEPGLLLDPERRGAPDLQPRHPRRRPVRGDQGERDRDPDGHDHEHRHDDHDDARDEPGQQHGFGSDDRRRTGQAAGRSRRWSLRRSATR